MAEDDDPPEDTHTTGVDWQSRNKGTTARLSKARVEIGNLETRIGELEPLAEAAQTLRGQVETLTAQLADAQSGRAFDQAVYGHGITDPEALTLLQSQYSGLAGDKRPEPGEWLKGVVEREEGPPKWLSPYLPASGDNSETTDTDSTAITTPARKQRPNPNKGVDTSEQTNGARPPTVEEIQGALAQAQRGDRTAWDSVQSRLGQAVPKLGS